MGFIKWFKREILDKEDSIEKEKKEQELLELQLKRIEKDKQDSIFVENVMSKDVISLSPEDDAIDAFKLMARKNIGRLIVKEHGKVVGIVSRSDLLHAIKMKEV